MIDKYADATNNTIEQNDMMIMIVIDVGLLSMLNLLDN